VPEEMPPLEKHQVYGLATPEDFTLPPHHPLWTEETYATFQVSEEASEKYESKVRYCMLSFPLDKDLPIHVKYACMLHVTHF